MSRILLYAFAGYISCPHIRILTFIILLAFSFNVNASREVSEKRECATCHIMWLKEFNRKDIKTLIPFEPKPVVASGKQDVSSTSQMCFSCHDGFVLDSRSMWRDKNHNHPVGVKPSIKIVIPKSNGKTIFPLNDDGNVYCGTCHTAHGVDWNQKESPVFLRVKNVESSMCLACHLEKSTGSDEGNHPIFKKPDSLPNDLLQAGSKFAGDGGVICQSCHMPHGSINKNMLVMQTSDSELCVTCHSDKKRIKKSKHNTHKESRNSFEKKEGSEGVCSVCHKPHGASGPMLSVKDAPNIKDKAAGRCIACHQKDDIAKDKTLGVHTHPTNVSISKLGIRNEGGKWSASEGMLLGGETQELPLYDEKGRKSGVGGRISCGTCHDPHVWSLSGQPEKTKDGNYIEGDYLSSFLRINREDQSALCVNCHAKKKSIISTKHNMLSNKKLDVNQIVSGGVCGQCHTPHNAHSTALRSRMSAKGISPFSNFCLSCHKPDGFASDRLIGDYTHPVGVNLNNISAKSSDLPLYDQNGIKVTQDGMVDCVTCHDVHKYTTEGLSDIGEKSLDNKFLRLSINNDSGLCVECHGDKKYVIGTDHDMSVTSPDAVNHQGKTVAHSGVCGQCHSVHNALIKENLWAREPAKAVSMAEKMCLGCHQKNQAAERKVPLQLTHPEDVAVWSGSVRKKRITDNPIPEIPVFDSDGKRSHVGVITCLSCHDPHKWKPGHDMRKPGDKNNYEGDAMTSFLRNTNSEMIICADCHGEDAIFRYKYFHGETSRKDYPLYQ